MSKNMANAELSRRNFLRLAGAIGTAAILGTVPKAEAQPTIPDERRPQEVSTPRAGITPEVTVQPLTPEQENLQQLTRVYQGLEEEKQQQQTEELQKAIEQGEVSIGQMREINPEYVKPEYRNVESKPQQSIEVTPISDKLNFNIKDYLTSESFRNSGLVMFARNKRTGKIYAGNLADKYDLLQISQGVKNETFTVWAEYVQDKDRIQKLGLEIDPTKPISERPVILNYPTVMYNDTNGAGVRFGATQQPEAQYITRGDTMDFEMTEDRAMKLNIFGGLTNNVFDCQVWQNVFGQWHPFPLYQTHPEASNLAVAFGKGKYRVQFIGREKPNSLGVMHYDNRGVQVAENGGLNLSFYADLPDKITKLRAPESIQYGYNPRIEYEIETQGQLRGLTSTLTGAIETGNADFTAVFASLADLIESINPPELAETNPSGQFDVSLVIKDLPRTCLNLEALGINGFPPTLTVDIHTYSSPSREDGRLTVDLKDQNGNTIEVNVILKPMTTPIPTKTAEATRTATATPSPSPTLVISATPTPEELMKVYIPGILKALARNEATPTPEPKNTSTPTPGKTPTHQNYTVTLPVIVK